MRGLSRLSTLLIFCAICFGQANEDRKLVSGRFPDREDLAILCWSVPDADGYLSQILVFRNDGQGKARVLWESPLDYAYSPQIQFVRDITVEGVPLALVERQTGAASSHLDVIGKSAGRIARLLSIDGFKFDVQRLDGSKLPFIVAHVDASTLDVPTIYRWNGSRFVDDSASHPNFYKQLLADDKARLPEGSSGVVRVNLSRIALLSGDYREAKAILDQALSNEQSKGDESDPLTLQLINKALHSLAGGTQ